MKRTLSFLTLFLFLALASKAQNVIVHQVCFDDEFGYHWYFNDITDNGDGTWYAMGHVDNAYPEGDATLWVDARNGLRGASVRVAAINAAADGCTFYSDSFVYVGTADIYLNQYYSGSGTWQSYCFGGVINAGTWAGSGPTCNGASKVKVNPNVKAYPAKANHDDGFSINAAPNPVKSFTQIQYKVSVASKVNITIYDYMHRPVKELVNESKSPGKYSVNWNAMNASGTRVQQGLYKVVANVNGKVYSSTIQVQ
jgi:hypothetical protein